MSHDDDRVGYGRPPKHTQFKKGQSGNPSGGWRARRENKKNKRREQKENISQILEDYFCEPVKVTINGRTETLPRIELALRRLGEEAIAKGDLKALQRFFDLAEKLDLLKVAQTPEHRPGVLVVPGMLSLKDWTEQTEGQKLPKDPLHGTPFEGRKLIAARKRGDSAD